VSCFSIRRGIVPIVAVLSTVVSAGAADEEPPSAPSMVAFSPDGQRLAVVTGKPDSKCALTVWDTATLRRLWAHRDRPGIPAVAFAPDGKTLAIGHFTDEVKVLDSVAGRLQATYGGHGKAARAVGFAPDGRFLAVGTYEGFIKLWDLAQNTEWRTLRGHTGRIYSVVFSADGQRLLSAGAEAARLWDLGTGQEQHVLRHDGSLVHAGLFSPDGRSVLTGGWDGTARLWDAQTGKPIWSMENRGGVDVLAYCASKDILALGGHGHRIELISPIFRTCDETQRRRFETLLARLDDDSYAVREAASREILQMGLIVEPALRRAMTEGTSAEVRLRCRRLRHELLTTPQVELSGHTDEVESLAFTLDGRLLASASRDGTVRLWDVATRRERGWLTPTESAGHLTDNPAGGGAEGHPGR
jgi:WD40 repeat protein